MTSKELEELLQELESSHKDSGDPTVDVAALRRLVERRGKSPADTEPRAESPNTFYEWAIKRLEKRQRRLVAAVVVLAVLAALGTGFAAAALGGRSEPAQSAAPGEMAAVRKDIAALRTDLDRRLEHLAASVTDVSETAAGVRKELHSLRRCTNRSLGELDRGLKGLVTRRISPDAWVRRPPIRCP